MVLEAKNGRLSGVCRREKMNPQKIKKFEGFVFLKMRQKKPFLGIFFQNPAPNDVFEKIGGHLKRSFKTDAFLQLAQLVLVKVKTSPLSTQNSQISAKNVGLEAFSSLKREVSTFTNTRHWRAKKLSVLNDRFDPTVSGARGKD
jgi:hypothetical protein